MRLRRIVRRHPLGAALVFEGMLIPLALALALLLGVRPWTQFHSSAETVLVSVAATLPLLAFLGLFAAARPAWFEEIDARVRQLIESLFRGCGYGPVLAVSALAGLGEELLFRGVVQAWLTGLAGPWTGVILASGLFGLAHAVTRAYFVLAMAMGVYLGMLYHLTGNLLLPTLVHALYDAIAIIYLLRAARGRDATAGGG